jgi:hypothetical protein
MTTPVARLVTREALLLPLLLTAVAAGGGFRSDVLTGAWRFLPPSPMALVLGVLQVGILIRTGVLAPWALIGPHRSGLANANGAMVLLTLLIASAQVFTALSPERGLLHVLATVFFLLMLVNTLAAVPTRARAMQSLGVVLLSAFVLKHVVLDALYAPEGSLARKVVTTLLEGVSLGALGYTAHGPATAYVAFVVIAAYLFALVLLPGDIDASVAVAPPRTSRDRRIEDETPAVAAVLPATPSKRSLTTTSLTPSSDARAGRPDPDDR